MRHGIPSPIATKNRLLHNRLRNCKQKWKKEGGNKYYSIHTKFKEKKLQLKCNLYLCIGIPAKCVKTVKEDNKITNDWLINIQLHFILACFWDKPDLRKDVAVLTSEFYLEFTY